jgi:Pentapeptide repeats (8 copies)
VPEVSDPPESAGAPGEPPLSPATSATAPSPDPAPGPNLSARARRRRARVAEPTQQELDTLPVKDRLELLERRRAARHQTLNSVGILFGVLFTAASLIATALTWRTGQDDLRTAQQGQITERYTQATQQLGSPQREVRLSAIYALERISHDSPRDQPTITDVLAAFAREHDPAPAIPSAKLPAEPDTDVLAALTVVGRLPPPTHPGTGTGPGTGVDLHGIRTPHAQLPAATLTRATLTRANLTDANLTQANLNNADLDHADLDHANLDHANLGDANLFFTNLFFADLDHANLTGAHLFFAHLDNADLTGADLTGAGLNNADLTGANLTGAHLGGADLHGVHGMSADQIRNVAVTDAATRF